MASTSSTERPQGSRAGLPVRLTWITLALGALAAYPAYRFGGRECVQAMLLGAALSLVTIVSSYLALSAVFARSRQLLAVIVLGGFVVRVAMLFAMLAFIARNFDVALEQVVLWSVGFYFLLILVEARELDAISRKRFPEA